MISSSSRSVSDAYILNRLYNYLFRVPEVPLATCQEQLSVDSTHVCAGAELGKDACSGDSGGGLFIEDSSHTWHLLGIVSYGARDCGNGLPGVYTRVSPFLDWICATRDAME